MAKTEAEGTDFGEMFGKLEVTLGEYLGEKAPQLPKSWKEVLVKFAPYLTILGVVVGVMGFLALLGLGAFLVPLGTIGAMMSGRPFVGFSYITNIVFLGLMVLLEGLAVPGLFSRSKKAWTIYIGVPWLASSRMLSALMSEDW